MTGLEASRPAAELASVEALRRTLEEAGASPRPLHDIDLQADPVRLTEELVGARAAVLLRRCAVPHEFDEELLQCMGELSRAEAESQFEAFVDLSVIQINASSLSLHERWRVPLWQWWLKPQQAPEFAALNERLAAYFTRAPSATGEDPFARRRMFHLLGCRRSEGMDEFERLIRLARHRRRFSECSLLIGLVREYLPVLGARDRELLLYHEAKLAIDLRHYDQASPLLQGLAGPDTLDARLRVNSQARLAFVMRRQGRLQEAIDLLRDALPRAGGGSRWRLLYELGEAYRDRGDLDDALQALESAIGLEHDEFSDPDMPGLHNALGTVQLLMRDAPAALASFEASLHEMQALGGGDQRAGLVHNNIGLAHFDCAQWDHACAAFERSLRIKREAGDVLGQATTLRNLGQARLALGQSAAGLAAFDEAQRLFAAGGAESAAADVARLKARMQARQPDAASPPRKRRWVWWLAAVLVLLLALLAAIE